MTKSQTERRGQPALVALSWLWVGLPFGYGGVELVTKATQLFGN